MKHPLHLIPGTMCTSALWSKLLPRLPSDWEMRLQTIPRDKHFDAIVDDYAKHWPRENLHLIGFSLGGYIASYFACRYPERVAKVFVVSNSPKALPDEEVTRRENTVRLVEQHGYSGMGETQAKAMLDPSHHGSEFVQTLIRMDRELGKDEYLSQIKNTTRREDLANRLKACPVPITYFVSEGDVLIDQAWLNDVAAANPSIHIHRTTGKGHMLPLEKPDEVQEQLLRWLEN